MFRGAAYHCQPAFRVSGKPDDAQYPAERFRHFCHKVGEQPESHLGVVQVGLQFYRLLEREVSLSSFGDRFEHGIVGLVRQPPVPVNSAQVEERHCIGVAGVEEVFAHGDHVVRFLEERPVFLFVPCQRVEPEVDHASEEIAARIAGRHSPDGIECGGRFIDLHVVQPVDPPHRCGMDESPVRLAGRRRRGAEEEQAGGNHDMSEDAFHRHERYRAGTREASADPAGRFTRGVS